jgi:hypothetical protein
MKVITVEYDDRLVDQLLEIKLRNRYVQGKAQSRKLQKLEVIFRNKYTMVVKGITAFTNIMID